MLIKTLRQHENGYGDNYVKKPGDEYNHPEPGPLLIQKFAEEVSHDKDDSKDGGIRGDGEAPLSTEKLDGEEHGRAVDGEELGADADTSEEPSAKGQRGTKKRDRDLPKSNKRKKD